ncbi:MAG TPA: S24 family peptidase [Woeseiaceae bacterium]
MGGMEPGQIIETLRRLNVPHDEIAETINRDRSAATKMMNGKRSMKANEVDRLAALAAKYERDAGESASARQATTLDEEFGSDVLGAYVQVDVLPTYAGMGGGGTGDADSRAALLPRALVEGELHAKAEDLLVVPVRGTSMEPDFFQGDQLLIDRRDTNPRQPGPFALWDGDSYVVKNVEWAPGKEDCYRIFATNERYSEWIVKADDIKIMGRPVWYARRL